HLWRPLIGTIIYGSILTILLVMPAAGTHVRRGYLRETNLRVARRKVVDIVGEFVGFWPLRWALHRVTRRGGPFSPARKLRPGGYRRGGLQSNNRDRPILPSQPLLVVRRRRHELPGWHSRCVARRTRQGRALACSPGTRWRAVAVHHHAASTYSVPPLSITAASDCGGGGAPPNRVSPAVRARWRPRSP